MKSQKIKYSINLTFFLILILLNTLCASSQAINNEPQKSNKSARNNEIEFIKQRLTKDYANLLQGNMWTLTHTSKSKEKLDTVMKLLLDFLTALDKPTESNLKKINGIKGVKESFARYLIDDDDTIKGFSATMLGIIGDKNYTPQIAKILDERDESFTDKYSGDIIVSRGKSAVAIAMLNSRTYTYKIADLLKSKNEYDRRGAIVALGMLKNTSYTKEIIALLMNNDPSIADDDSPIYYLLENNLLEDYKDEIAKVMLKTFSSEIAESAAYALAKIQAKDKKAEIAKLLKIEFRKGSAAKVLALMDEKEYSNEIAKLLNDKSSLVQKDAVLSLGVLRAKKYIPQIAKLLKAKEDFVRYYAAVSLILLEAKDYYKVIIPLIEKTHKSGAYLNAGDFHIIALEESRQLKSRFEALLKTAKSEN